MDEIKVMDLNREKRKKENPTEDVKKTTDGTGKIERDGTARNHQQKNRGPTVLKREKTDTERIKEKHRRKQRSVQQSEIREQKTKSHHRVKKKKQRMRLAQVVARILLLLIVAAAVAFLIIINMYRLKEIRIVGNKNFSEDQIIEMVGIPSDADNTLLTYLKYKDEKANDKPSIKDLSIYMEDRNTLCIEVTETVVVGEIKHHGSYYCFDDSGYVQEILDSRNQSVPKVTGINVEEAALGDQIKTDDDSYFANIRDLCQMLIERKLSADEIEVTGDNAIMIYIDDHICVAFGSPLLMEAKVSEIVNILPELLVMEEEEGLEGVLHLENYSNYQKSIVFTPGELIERNLDDEDTDQKKSDESEGMSQTDETVEDSDIESYENEDGEYDNEYYSDVSDNVYTDYDSD